MKKRHLLVFIILSFGVSAQTNLPINVQADLIENRIYDFVRAENYEAALGEFDNYRNLGVSVPLPLLYFEGVTAYTVNDYVRAKAALEEYFNFDGVREDPNYDQALELYINVESPAQDQALLAEEEAIWNSSTQNGTTELIFEYGYYVEENPDGAFVSEADEKAWELAIASDSLYGFSEYLSYFSDGNYAEIAEAAAWDWVTTYDEMYLYLEFNTYFPESERKQEVYERALQKALENDSLQSYSQFLGIFSGRSGAEQVLSRFRAGIQQLITEQQVDQVCDDCFQTPVMMAVAANDVRTIEALINAGANPNKTMEDHDPEDTPLSRALTSGKTEAALAILRFSNPAELYLGSPYDTFSHALYQAIEGESWQVAQAIVDSGADLSAALNSGEDWYYNPLVKAAEAGRGELLESMLASTRRISEIVATAALLPALYHESISLAALSALVDKGADPNTTDFDGDVFVYELFSEFTYSFSTEEDFQIFKRIAERYSAIGGEYDVLFTDFLMDERTTIVHKIAENEDPRFLEVFLDNGADPDTPDGIGLTPIYNAIYSFDNHRVVEMLIDRGARWRRGPRGAKTPLEFAEELGATESARILRSAGNF